MRIAILGTRGIPANYGGFETFAEELSARLAARGHDVSVFCRSHYVDPALESHRGVRLVVLPTVQTKYLDTVIHSFISALRVMRSAYDVVLICNAANSFICGLLSWARKPTILNVDGIERMRKKWGWPGRSFYSLSEILAVRLATCLVSDAKVIQDYYRERHRAASFFIPYGFAAPDRNDQSVLQRFQVAPFGYYLYVSRLEPENNTHVVITAHGESGSQVPMLIVGDAPYATRYKCFLKKIAGPRVTFCGSVYGPAYHTLQANALAYVQATEIGGTHPALVEAMGHGNLVLANDTPENREVLADTGLYYERNDIASLARLILEAERDTSLRSYYGGRAQSRVKAFYNWEDITDRYLKVFKEAQDHFAD